jgi:hypothetical protein
MWEDQLQQEGVILLASAEELVPADHLLRTIRRLFDAALERKSPALEALLRRTHPDPLCDPLQAPHLPAP